MPISACGPHKQTGNSRTHLTAVLEHVEFPTTDGEESQHLTRTRYPVSEFQEILVGS